MHWKTKTRNVFLVGTLTATVWSLLRSATVDLSLHQPPEQEKLMGWRTPSTPSFASKTSAETTFIRSSATNVNANNKIWRHSSFSAVKNANHSAHLFSNKQSSLLSNQQFVKLCKLCLDVVITAPSIDLTYVNYLQHSQDHHPPATSRDPFLHMGAVDEHGRLGYVHDETALYRQRYQHSQTTPPQQDQQQSMMFHPFNSSKDPALLEHCRNHDDTFIMLQQKIRVVSEETIQEQRRQLAAKTMNATPQINIRRPIRLLCMIYTTEAGHAKIQRIRETWGYKCNGFLVASNVTRPALPTVHILHRGVEDYQNMWQKVRSLWSYVYDHYYDKYDWFHIGGDDVYLIVENLRYYLESEEIFLASHGGWFPAGNQQQTVTNMQTPLYLGKRHRRVGNRHEFFNSGGSGYTLNQAALKALVLQGLPHWYVNVTSSAEDVYIARTFRELGIYPYETKDAYGGERYGPRTPGFLYRWRPTKNPQDGPWYWYTKFSIDPKFGLDHCAKYSVAFHYIKGDDMYRLHALLYNLCPVETLEFTAEDMEKQKTAARATGSSAQKRRSSSYNRSIPYVRRKYRVQEQKRNGNATI